MNRSVWLLCLSVACVPGVDDAQWAPPGVGGITLSGPQQVFEGETYLWTVQASDLAAGDRVAIGWGDLNQPGRCPHQPQANNLCLEIDRTGGQAQRIMETRAIATPRGAFAFFEFEAPNTRFSRIFLQSLKIARASSGTSNVLAVDILADECAVNNGGCGAQDCANSLSGPVCSCPGGTIDTGGDCELITAFQTAGRYEPGVDFVGILEADGLCQTEAAAAGFEHADSFFALLSTSVRSARHRAVPDFPLTLASGGVLAVDEADLWDGSIGTQFYVTATGSLNGAQTWTGTVSNGDAEPAYTTSPRRTYCNDWNGSTSSEVATVGLAGSTDGAWVNQWDPNVPTGQGDSCPQDHALYCMSGTVCPSGQLAIGGSCIAAP